jgi:two-component system sensor histidine kinase ChvG
VTFAVAGVALALYSRHYSFWQLAAIVLPSAAVVGWWLGWRLVRPIERLRAQALEQARTVSPGAEFELVRADEFGELAGAFNRLLTELRSRAKDKEAFVADLAHEFKNPIAAIRAASEALQTRPDDPARLDRLARIVRDSSQRLDGLVTQFLELARAEAGLSGDERTPVDVGALARARVRQFADDPRFDHLEFVVQADPLSLHAVETGLQTVVDNLLENASSFAARRVEVLVHGDGSTAYLEVHDDGPGIAPEDRARVFDRYFTRRASGKGTGLGLAMVRALVGAHAGSVHATPRDGGGTVFVAQLPLERP